LCGLCCYIGCPPIPESIARKLAFHPPKKGVSYTVHLVSDPNKNIKGANELEGREFVITPTPLEMTTVFDYERLLTRIKDSGDWRPAMLGYDRPLDEHSFGLENVSQMLLLLLVLETGCVLMGTL
ncbi:hypothetical protein COOONC_22191, partial [Cooperia oncophora]